jgi:hypothetical protein
VAEITTALFHQQLHQIAERLEELAAQCEEVGYSGRLLRRAATLCGEQGLAIVKKTGDGRIEAIHGPAS